MVVGGTVIGWCTDVDMRNGHDGLAEIIKKEVGMRVGELKPGQFVLCINTSWSQFKMYGADGFLVHYKSPDGNKLNYKALLKLPGQFMRGQRINYKQALHEEVREWYAEHHPRLYAHVAPEVGADLH